MHIQAISLEEVEVPSFLARINLRDEGRLQEEGLQSRSQGQRLSIKPSVWGSITGGGYPLPPLGLSTWPTPGGSPASNTAPNTTGDQYVFVNCLVD